MKNPVYIWNFGDEFLVVCPKCKKCAEVISSYQNEKINARLVCAHCGNVKDWKIKSSGILYAQNKALFREGEISIGDSVDWYFHEPLWLQARCCGNTLWAYNKKHLEWLRDFVSAKLRERIYDEEHGWSNRALASRLPKWISSAQNREEILSTIANLITKIHERQSQ